MTRQIHSAPSTWGVEMEKANSNAEELYTAVEDLQNQIGGIAVSSEDTEYVRSFDFMYNPSGSRVNDINFATYDLTLVTLNSEAGHTGVIGFDTVANRTGAFNAGINMTMFPVGTEASVVVHFKSAPTDSVITLLLGTFVMGNTLHNESGLQVGSSNARMRVYTGSLIREQDSNPISITPSTWYIAKYEMLANDTFKVSLFSSSGELLYTYTSTQNVYTNSSSMLGVKISSSSSTSVKTTPILDKIEIRVKINPSRVKV